jgi:arginase
MLLAPWTSRFRDRTGMEQGPAVLAAAIGGAADEVDVTLGGPAAEAIGAVAAAVAAEDRRPLALLGECTLTPGVAAGLQRRYDDLALVWLDAHGDLNTPATSPSGFLGGMPFAILLGWCHPELRPGPPLPVERAALVGARDLDPGEIEAIERTGLAWTADVAGALAALPDDAPLWVHLDGDVLDPADAPGVDFPAPGGWSAGRLVDECAALAATGRVVAVSVCCGNPDRDPDGIGARHYAAAVRALLQ